MFDRGGVIGRQISKNSNGPVTPKGIGPGLIERSLPSRHLRLDAEYGAQREQRFMADDAT